MKRKLFAIFLTAVMTLNGVLSSGLNALGASVTLAAPELKLKSYATKAVLSWNYNSKADGYQIYWCGGDTSSVPHNNQSGNCWNERVKLKTISSNNTTSYTKTDLSYKKNYHFKVRAYKKSGSSVIYSGWSDEECTIDTVNRLNAASLKTRTSYKTINVQGEKNTLFADHTLTDKEKTILGNFAKSHFKDDWTPGEKIQYTAEWIRNNMTYLHDYSQIKTYSYTENIFKYKEGQCSDYNGALIEMMIYLGFDARLIMGYRNGSAQHFWGEVIIDGSVFLMEVGEKISDSPQWGYKWMFLCNTYSEADGGYYKNGKAAKDSIASYPAVVTGLKVSSKTIDSVNLEWSKSSGAAGYDVYQYNNSQKKWTKIVRTSASVNTYKVSKLSAGTEYKFAVKAYKTANGQEIYSVSLSTLTAVTNPAAVTGFKVNSMSDSAVNLTWNKVKSAEGYIIYQYNNSNKTWSRIAKTTTTANSFKVTNLNAGTKYQFAIRAYRTENGKEITSPSYPALSVTTKPAAVTGFKVSAVSDSAVNLTWNKVKSAEGYIIYQYNNSKKTWSRIAKTTTTANSFKVTNLNAGTEYQFAIRAYRTENGKEIASPSYPALNVITNPAAVAGFKISSMSDNSANLTWNKVKSAEGYIIYQYNTSKKAWSRIAKTTTTANSFKVTNLNAGTKYQFAIRAYRTENGKEITSPSYPALSVITKPATVTGFKVSTVSDNAVNLTWNKMKSAEGYIIYQYNNTKNSWSRIAKTTTTVNSYKVTNLNAGTKYQFAIRAYRTENGKEITSPSYPILNTVTKPAAVTAFKVTSVSANSVNLTWSKVKSAEGYIVYQYNDSKKTWNRIAKIKGTSYTVSKLSSGTSYKFAVKPYLTFEGKEVGCSKYMELFTSTLPDKVRFMVKTDSDKTTVTWDKVNGATGYIVYYKKNSNDSWHKLTVTSGTSYTNNGLKRNKDYIFAVKAYRIAEGQTYNGKYYTSAFPYIVNKDGLTYVDGILIANKTYGLPSDYNPGLTDETKRAFENMKRDAAKENISLFISSGFRSYNYQKTLYNGYVDRDGKKAAEKYSARPGHSEHQTGLAIDVNNPSSSFINTKEAKWLEKNCWKYGFIIRYPNGKENITGYQYEPWHVRYVGTSLAKTLTENKLTIEEFYSLTSVYDK